MRTRLLFGLLLCLVMASCALPRRGAPTPFATETPLPKATSLPTATPIIPLTILVIPADLPQEESTLYQKTVYDLAYAAGMRFQVLNTLTPLDLELAGPALKVVIVFPPDPGLADLIRQAPQAQFLAVGIPNLAPAANLTVLGAANRPVEQQAFLAGYITAMLSPDYRTGILTLGDDPQGLAAETAFLNGRKFYCGLCLASFPPWYDYPLHIQVPPETDEDHYPAYVRAFRNYQVEAVYVYPPLATPDVLTLLAEYKIKIVGESLTLEEIRDQWVVSIQPDLLAAVRQVFPELVAGQGGREIAIPLFLNDINEDLLSEGKLRLVRQVLEDLQMQRLHWHRRPSLRRLLCVLFP